MNYPGRIIKLGEQDALVVQALKTQLNKQLALKGSEAVHLDPENPNFGPNMQSAVKLFQARNLDREHRPLKIDGHVGSITWEALFGEQPSSVHPQLPSPYLANVLLVAASEADRHVLEYPRNSNRGTEVDEYLRTAGAPLGVAWCCAFVYYCFEQASKDPARPNPMVKTAGCLDHWNKAQSKGARRITTSQATANPALVSSGMIFIMDFGSGKGHTGLIEKVEGGYISTIEGNTDASKTREGGGVYRLTRKIAEINKGFIDYTSL